MAHPDPSRRDFLFTAGGAVSSLWLTANAPAIGAAARWAHSVAGSGQAFGVLSAAEARTIEAATARIIPTTDTPGAREAGVVFFVDRALGTFMAPARDGVGGFARAMDERAAETAGTGITFADLDEANQDEVLRGLDEADPAGFGLLQALTVMGTFSNPSHGGNRDRVGWRMIGFAPAERFDPPFGYYDAEYARQGGGP